MDLSRRSRLPPLIVFIILLCTRIQTSHSRFFGERLKRQNGAHMYLSASSIIPGGEGEDASEWSDWSSPSECSRSCGGGVSFQTRECSRTEHDGAPLCTGGNRKYFSCNTQDCPEEESDFRAQQCSRFNHQAFDGIFYEWVPYTNAPNPCELNCMPKGERFYYRHKAKVIDGTRCNDQDLDVCVDGQCQSVGCDMMLGSDAKEDNCRKCGGDGTTCRNIADKFTTNNLAAGYNDLLLVPSGATNIRIQETTPSNNYLACRNLSSHYFLNGNWRIDFPRPMFFAGCWWNYQRKPTGFAAPDQLSCRGPITEAVYIVMLVQDKNVSIEYEYSIPQSVSSSTPDVYTWTHMEYEPCSASCGGGTQTRTVTCNNRLNLEEVEESFCDERAKPAESQECGMEPCAPHWVSSEWSKCSKGCGSDGIQNRNVACERISPSGEHTVEDDAVCLEQVGNKPANQQECNRDNKNCPKYHLGPWSPCDKLCGEGKQKRKVTCYIEEGGRKKVLTDNDCIEDKPETEKMCMLTPCEGVDWIISPWSGCDACGQTTETRVAICSSTTGKVYDDEFCAPETPLLTRPCESKKCQTQWFTSEWSKCSSPCGKGIQSRVVLCGEFDGKTITKVADDSQCEAAIKPEAEQECEGEDKECPGQWFAGPWESCTKPCDGGERHREILCLANGTKSNNCDESKMESLSEKCNTQACTEDELMPVVSTDNPVTDAGYDDDCEEEDDDDGVLKLVTDKMNEDLKITDGIELDEESTLSSLITDDLMLSDSTYAVDTTDENSSTDVPLTTADGSGDESTDMSTVVTEGSGDDMETSSAITDTTDLPQSTEAWATDITTEATESSNSTDISPSTDTFKSTEPSTDFTNASGSTDESIQWSTTESSDTTDISKSTTLSTESSVSTDRPDEFTDIEEISHTTDSVSSTDILESSSTNEFETTISNDISTSSDTSIIASSITDTSTEFPSSAEVTSSTEISLSTDSSTASSESTEPTDSSTTQAIDSTSDATDSTTQSLDSTTVSAESTTAVDSEATETSESIDVTSSTDDSKATDLSESTTTDVSISSTSPSASDFSETTEPSDLISSTTIDINTSTDVSLSTDISILSESTETATTDSSVTTDISKSTDILESSESTDISTTSISSDISTDSTGVAESSSEQIEISTSSSTFDLSTEIGSTDVQQTTDETTETSSDEITNVSDDILLESTTSSDIPDSTTDDTEGSSLSTEEFTTVDIWTTEEDFEKSTPNTLEAAITKESKPKKCKARKLKECKNTEHGCCPDGKHTATGPFDKGCPIAKTCSETEFGCCHDGVSAAAGKHFEDCPKSQCAETLFGCCPDKFTPAEGEDNEGCPETTTVPLTTTTQIPEEVKSPETSGDISGRTEGIPPKATVHSCSFSEFGCCPDSETAASGNNFAGCRDMVDPNDCRNSVFGCCNDGRTSATGPDNEGCHACTSEPYGCCPDNETPAHGPLGEGCCLNSVYGCCPDNINSARGPNFEGCDCQYGPYGCCPDKRTAARGHNNEGCGCEFSAFGCCPDKITPALGPKFEGCLCHTLQFGCCPDGITVAQGPHHYGCHCSQTEFKCCPDEKTPAKGPNNEGCTCLESKHGCCPDGITSAEGDKFEGCENVKEPPQLACKLPKETGSCGNFSIKFFFDTSYGACAKFWYGGCEGNGNRFDSEGECKETCQDFKGKDACLLPKSQGPCTGYITKWYYDAERSRCEEFKYGGCYGTNNRFDSMEECQSFCSVSENIPPCEQPVDEGPCEGSFERWFYDNETDVCRSFRYGGCKGNKNNYPTEHACNYHCRQPGVHKDYCSIPKNTGNCGEKHARWHYSEADRKCMPFYYTGCGGNKNNFPSLESCEDHCPKQVAKDICEIPAEVGKCTNYEPMWYYDTKDQRCRQFYYGGCGGNENKFNSEDACMQRCEKKPEPELESIPGPENVPERAQPPLSGINVCDEKPDQGDCDDFTMWWHFDRDNYVCRQFYYGGCGGNGNRFSSQEDCEQKCIDDHSRNPEEPVPIQPKQQPEDDVCLLPAVTGDCANYTQVWYFDSSKSQCSLFYYGGCGGNGNRFASEEECNTQCGVDPGFHTRFEPDLYASPDVNDTQKCFLSVATGNCLDYQLRWHYNSVDGVCDQFAFTGCDGNANNFVSEDECENECFPAQETCVLPPLRGNCNESMMRWHFNQDTGSCSEFEFTGCRGNRNNFVTEQECMLRCGGGEPPAPTYSVCDQPLDAGECDNSTTAWHYDTESMFCVAFTYTGCGGNGNRFQSREQCERQCGEFKGVDVCNEEVSTGPCRQWQTRYYFNKLTRTCEAFTYGGCQGTGNRFENRGECESVCIIGQEPTFEHNKDICKEPVDVGRCSGSTATERRWYYDDARGNCISFIYSGCAGNQNNFRSYESCYNYCSKPDITNEVLPNRCETYESECSTMSCPYGVRRIPVDEECQRCECKNPCAEHQCDEGQQCAIEVSPEMHGQFVPVCRLIEKPGICPHLRANDGVCGRECYTDADCRADSKCCSNGCGFMCVRPTPPTLRTTPPTTAAPVIVYPGEVQASLVPKQRPELDVQTPMGGIAVLRCFATGNPAPNVTWSRNNVVVDTNQGRYVLTSSGDLTIVQVRQTDSGSYVCVASNGLGEPVRREIELQVTDPVNMPAYVYGDRNVTQIVTLNRPAVVRCPAGGHPAPMVHWWRNRNRLPLVSQRFELARDYSLTFRSMQLSDLGPYTCEAWNRLSRRPASIKVTLVAVGPARAVTNDDAQYLQYVVEPPRAPATQRPSFPYRPTRPPAVPPPYVPAIPVNAVIGMDPSNNYAPGSTIAMGCSVQGYPKPDVTWIKDGLPLLPNERIQISVGEPYRLIINNISTADSGSYGCKAANAVSYSISEESVNIESTIPLNPECIDNEHFANCKLIVKGRYCKNKYYARFCCRSCALAGQL